MIYALTGPLGTGKSMMATQRAIDYACQGRKVAANYHVDFREIAHRRSSALSAASVTVLPAVVSSDDLHALGRGGPRNREDQAGLLILDEADLFLNARTWNEEDRLKKMKWLKLSRKRGWDVLLLVQGLSMLDKQLRELIEVTGRIRRSDRIKVPFTRIAMPRFHLAAMRYGLSGNDFVIERWLTRGDEAVKCYDTGTIFDEEAGAYCVLPATLSKWRYIPRPPWQLALQAAIDATLALFGKPPPKKQTRWRGPPGWLEGVQAERRLALARYLASLDEERAARVVARLEAAHAAKVAARERPDRDGTVVQLRFPPAEQKAYA